MTTEPNCNRQITWGDIKGFSHKIYNALGVLAIVYPILMILHILSEIWRIFDWNEDIVTFGNWQLYNIIPATTFGISFFGGSAFTPDSTPLNIIITILALVLANGVSIVAIFYFRSLFKELKNGMSPFHSKIVTKILSLAILITVFSILSFDIRNILLMLFMWLLYYIFDHGHKLQNESDTTL